MFGDGHSSEPRAAENLSHDCDDARSASSSPAKCNNNDDGDVLFQGIKNAHDEMRSAMPFSELIFAALILMAAAISNPAMTSLAWAADDGADALSVNGSAPPPVATSTATANANSGYDAAAAGGIGIGMGDWSGTGAGGTMQWVPDPVMPPSPSTEEGMVGDAAGFVDSNSDEGAKEDVTPNDGNTTPPAKDGAEPTIDEYGSEITEKDQKPFDYQSAADDLIKKSMPSTAKADTDKSKPFDDSRFAMDKEDKNVVEGLSFRLYDGRSK